MYIRKLFGIKHSVHNIEHRILLINSFLTYC